jgi:Schitoviridae exonuclease
MKFTNIHKIGLSTACFLAHDTYDYDGRPNAISATGLLKSTRQAVLTKRVDAKVQSMDISSLVASSFGNAVHDAVEGAWMNGNYKRALLKLGYPQSMIDRVVVNPGYIPNANGNLVKDPNAQPLAKNAIPVYMEIRSEKEVDGVHVTGKFDFCGHGELEDHKTTGVFTYMQKTNDEKYRLQGSIYRWLNQDIVTSDRMLINYTFTDWSKLRSMIEKAKGYPLFRMMSVPFTLMPLDETQAFVEGRIREIKANASKAEQDVIMCTPDELWESATVYKYYKNPQSKTRATKNFDNFAEAQQRLIADGSVGVVDIVKGMAKACLYCSAAGICSQAKQLVLEGRLDMEV